MKHSTGDWNFFLAWMLDNVVWVSPPSSLLFMVGGAYCLLKTSVMPVARGIEGRYITYIRASVAIRNTRLFFRFQDVNNYYCAEVREGNFGQRIIRRLGGVETVLRTTIINWLPVNNWRRTRVTWWNDAVGLVIRWEYWDGAAWTQITPDAYDAPNYWSGIGGRVGMGLIHAHRFNFDETYIYGTPT